VTASFYQRAIGLVVTSTTTERRTAYDAAGDLLITVESVTTES
jgi:hypothetical protein